MSPLTASIILACSLLVTALDTTTSRNPTFALRAWPYGNGTLSGPYSAEDIRLSALLTPSVSASGALGYFEIANYENWAVTYFYLNESSTLMAWGESPVQMPTSNWSEPVHYGATLTGSTGFRLKPATNNTYEHLVWGEEKGTFYTCWHDDNQYGPSIYWRDEGCALPAMCVDVLLLPQCTPQHPLLATTPTINSTCYVDLGHLCPSFCQGYVPNRA